MPKQERHAAAPQVETAMTRLSPEALFRLSRVYAQGWNAARTWSLRTGPAAEKATTNPHASEPDRGRWAEGYAGGLAGGGSRQKFIPGQASRRPAGK
jgi:hypothetical protein